MCSLFNYTVFLSFRGPDTRQGFTGYLYKSFVDRKFKTFLDDREIVRGHLIPLELLKAIKESKIFVIVFSEGYASSAYALEELATILDEFRKGNGRWVLPVYYYVDVLDVQRQTGCYGPPLEVHRTRVPPDKFHRWIQALCKVTDFPHVRLDRAKRKFEHEYIEEILLEVSKYAARSIGLHSRVLKVMSHLGSGSNGEVCVVGIYGVPGIGKTTVARAVYHFNAGRGFDSYCFLDKVGERLSEHGLMHLPLMLLSEIVGQNHNKFGNIDEGMSIINQKKLFLVLEDIDDSRQLQAIVQLTNCFHSGSKVIITAQDKCLFESQEIKRIYKVDELKKEEAFELLCLKAFNSKDFKAKYVNILNRAENFADGIPLLLEAIGSNLSGKQIRECESVLDQYELVTGKEIRKVLQVIFDTLEKNQQNMLIHIAYHLKEQQLAVVEASLHSEYKDCLKEGIKVLLDKSLMKINEDGQVTLHSLTLDMLKANETL